MGAIYWVCIWNTATTMGTLNDKKKFEIEMALKIKDPTERMKKIQEIINRYKNGEKTIKGGKERR